MVQTNAPKMEAQKGKEKRCALAGMPTLWTGPELDGVCMFMRSVYLVCVCIPFKLALVQTPQPNNEHNNEDEEDEDNHDTSWS